MVIVREDFAQALACAVTETFENMAFMEALPSSGSALLCPDDQPLCVILPILGPVQGELSLRAPNALLRKVAAVIFRCTEEAIEQPQLLDIAAELLNTLAGRFLSRLLSHDQIFQLGLPAQEQSSENADDRRCRSWFFTAENIAFSLGAVGDSLLALVDRMPISES